MATGANFDPLEKQSFGNIAEYRHADLATLAFEEWQLPSVSKPTTLSDESPSSLDVMMDDAWRLFVQNQGFEDLVIFEHS